MSKKKLILAGLVISSTIVFGCVCGFASNIERVGRRKVRVNKDSNIFKTEEVKKLEDAWKSLPVYTDKNNVTNSLNCAPSKMITSNVKNASGYGTYPTRKGVILVTSDSFLGILPTGHAAIVYRENTVVEALDTGVSTGKNNWNSCKKETFGVTVKETTKDQDAKTADWCYSQIGKPYNWNYLDVKTRSAFYCSQLIYAGYLDNYNIDLNTSVFWDAIHPMELVYSPKTKVIYFHKNE